MVLIFKQLSVMDVHPLILNLYVFGMTFFGFTVMAFSSKISVSISKKALVLLIIASIFAVIGNYFNVKGISAAPNPAYHTTITLARILIVGVLAVFLFHSDFNLINFMGMLITIIGIIMVSI